MGKSRKLKLLRRALHEQQAAKLPKETSSLKEIAVFISIIIIIGLIVYAKIPTNAFVWDDLHQIFNNKQTFVVQNIPYLFIKGFDFMYRPVFFATMSLLNSLFGLKPFFFHSLSVILHLTNTVLIFVLFRQFFKSRTAFFISLFFLVHPMNVEPVANISFMMELQYFLFGIASLLFLVSFQNIAFNKRLFISAVFLLLSLMAKESGILLVPIILSYFALFGKNNLVKVAVMLSVVLGLYFFTRIVIAGSPLIQNYTVPPYIPIQRLSLAQRLVNIPAIGIYYLVTFFFPVNLAVQQYWIVKTADFAHFALPLVFGLLIAGGTVWLARLLSKKDNSTYRYFLFFSCWLVIGLGFHLQIVPFTMTVADRWFYLPMIGLLGMVACLLSLIPPFVKRVLPAAAVILLILLMVRSIVRTYDWKNNYTLYSHDIQVLRDNFSLENDLGVELLQSDQRSAKLHLERSIKLAPDWWLNYTNLAGYYLQNKNMQQAKKNYERALQNGKDENTYEIYAKVLMHDSAPGSTESAKRIAEQGLAYHPQDWNLWERLALIDYQLGETDKGAAAAKKAYELSGDESYLSLSDAIAKGIKFEISD